MRIGKGLAAAALLLVSPSCITAGLWSKTSESREAVVDVLAVRHDGGRHWYLQVPPQPGAPTGWTVATPAEDSAAFAELARVAAEPSLASSPALYLSSWQGDDDRLDPLDASRHWSLTMSVQLEPTAFGKLHWCDGLRFGVWRSDKGARGTQDILVSSTCEVGPAPTIPDGLSTFAGSVRLRADLPREETYVNGATERMLLTPVTLVLDVATIPLLPVFGLFMVAFGRYVGH